MFDLEQLISPTCNCKSRAISRYSLALFYTCNAKSVLTASSVLTTQMEEVATWSRLWWKRRLPLLNCDLESSSPCLPWVNPIFTTLCKSPSHNLLPPCHNNAPTKYAFKFLLLIKWKNTIYWIPHQDSQLVPHWNQQGGCFFFIPGRKDHWNDQRNQTSTSLLEHSLTVASTEPQNGNWEWKCSALGSIASDLRMVPQAGRGLTK